MKKLENESFPQSASEIETTLVVLIPGIHDLLEYHLLLTY